MRRAGLRVSADGGQLSPSWIVYNKPKVATWEHAGVIMALGLSGGAKAGNPYTPPDFAH